MYSPFFDKKGQTLSIDKIKYGHLSQLVDCDEGHHVEYKLLLEDGGRAQLAKEITSFANCEGGWLIIGIICCVNKYHILSALSCLCFEEICESIPINSSCPVHFML